MKFGSKYANAFSISKFQRLFYAVRISRYINITAFIHVFVLRPTNTKTPLALCSKLYFMNK